MPEQEFQLAPALKAETLDARELPLCRLLLRNEHRFPWLVLVPRRPGTEEIYELEEADRVQLMDEMQRVAQALTKVTTARKINIALFGNMVRMLHVHVVARFEDDPAWPGSAVGFAPADPYATDALPTWWQDLLGELGL